MIQEARELLNSRVRTVGAGLSLAGLFAVYATQNWFLAFLGTESNTTFILARLFRVVMNDLFMLLLIYSWFNDRKILRIAISLQIIDTFLLLPLYLVFKLSLEGPAEISSPLLSQFHRIIVNPLLMVLLIPAVYFQRLTSPTNDQ